MMKFAFKTRDCVSKSHKNEEFSIKTEEFCTKNDEIVQLSARSHPLSGVGE